MADQAAARPSLGSSGSGALRLVKFALALALLPVCIGMTQGALEFCERFLNKSGASHVMIVLRWFLCGGAAFVLFAMVFWRPVVVYVFGHELIHALATWMCLGRVSNFSASARGGQVTSSKSNTLIRLAPYCVPLYALLAVGVYCALNRWWKPLGHQIHWLAFALGFFYAFHIGFTLWSLRRDQPDLKPDGWLFSIVLIYLANLAALALLMGFMLGGGDPKSAWIVLHDFSVSGWHHGMDLYRNVAAAGRRVMSSTSE